MSQVASYVYVCLFLFMRLWGRALNREGSEMQQELEFSLPASFSLTSGPHCSGFPRIVRNFAAVVFRSQENHGKERTNDVFESLSTSRCWKSRFLQPAELYCGHQCKICATSTPRYRQKGKYNEWFVHPR